jgi:hypothetical protein
MVVGKETSFTQLYTFLEGLNTGNIHTLPFVHYHYADEMHLRTNGVDRVTIDGELLPANVKSISVKKLPVQGRVFQAECNAAF